MPKIPPIQETEVGGLRFKTLNLNPSTTITTYSYFSNLKVDRIIEYEKFSSYRQKSQKSK
jgi:hypothetical protein